MVPLVMSSKMVMKMRMEKLHGSKRGGGGLGKSGQLEGKFNIMQVKLILYKEIHSHVSPLVLIE